MIRYFKEQIEKVKGENFPAKHMKLMYAGKYLMDNNRVCDYNLQEKNFVIAVIEPPKSKVITVEDTIPNGASTSSEGDPSLGPRIETLVQRILELGYTRTDIDHAFRAFCTHPDRAVEFLMPNIGVSEESSDDNSVSEEDTDDESLNDNPWPGTTG